MIYGEFFLLNFCSQMMYNKWWKAGTKVCPKIDYDPSKASALNVVNIGGIFVVLLCGLAFAILVSIGEFCLRVNIEGEKQPRGLRPLLMKKRKLGIKRSSTLWGQLYSTLLVLFLGQQDDESGTRRPTDCSSCQALAQDGQSVKYM